MVFFDAPRCILCYRCVRVCNEGMGVGALGVVNRGAVSEIVPNHDDHLECDECGACIDICPVGALTSGTYRYQTRPWEMKHVGTICTHCADGCKTTLGVRNDEIIRGNNRDRSGINGEFLCIKGRYALRFLRPPRAPAVAADAQERQARAGLLVGGARRRGREVQRDVKARGGKFGVIGSNHTTNEENFYLQKFARQVLGTNNIDHHRTGDVADAARRAERQDRRAGHDARICTSARPSWSSARDLAQQHPFLSFQIRANYRHHQRARLRRDAGPGARRQVRGRAASAPRRAGNSRASNRCATS